MPIIAETSIYPIAIAAAALFLGLVVLVSFIIFVKYFNLWLQAFVTRAQISMASLIACRLMAWFAARRTR